MKLARVFRLAVTLAFAGTIISFAVPGAFAQGRYTAQYSKSEVSGIIRRMEESADSFRRDFDRELADSNLTSSQKRRYRDNVDDFEDATDRLRREFDRQRRWWDARGQAREMLAKARAVNLMMNTIQFKRKLERQWNRLKKDVNTVADTYDLSGIDGGGWDGTDGGPTLAITPPTWAQGTFFGVAPNGSRITLVIDRSGSVNANVNGSVSYGYYLIGNVLRIGQARSVVTRLGDGIMTTRPDNNERISYRRVPAASNGGGGGWENASAVQPPSWAVGTFTGQAPNGSLVVLYIRADGRVTADVNGSASYGEFLDGNYIRINGITSSVTSLGRGIRTTRTDNGEVINYNRR